MSVSRPVFCDFNRCGCILNFYFKSYTIKSDFNKLLNTQYNCFTEFCGLTMDESVIFVGELRSGDSDICVCDDYEDNVKSTARGNKGKKSKKPLIDFGRETGESSGNIDKNQSTKELKQETEKCCLECPVCFEPMLNVSEVKATECGHLFCGNCLNRVMKEVRSKCPKCRKLLIKKHIRTVFLQ